MRLPVSDPQPPSRDRITRAVPYLSFFLTGIITTLLGPILPWLTARWRLADDEAGLFFTVQFAGSLVAGFASGLVVRRLGEARTISIGLGCMAIGATTLAAGPHGVALAGMSACGIGMGLTVPTTNILVARTFRTRASAALSAVNLAWGAGAAVWPLTIAASGAPRVAVLLLALALVVAAGTALGASDPEAPSRSGERSDWRAGVTPWHWAFFGVFFFLYGGAEPAIGGWMTELAHRLDPSAPAAVAAAAFWGGLTAGRAAVAVFVTESHEARTALGGAALAIVGAATLLVVSDARAAAAAGAVAGVGLAPLFPITVAALSRGNVRHLAGPLISLSGVGGAVLPWLVGVVSTRSASLQTGLLVPLAGCIALGSLHAAYWFRHRLAKAL